MRYASVITIRTRMIWSVLALALLMAVLPVTAQDTDSVAIAIVNGQIIDGTGAPPVPNGVVLIVGDRIDAVGPAIEIEIPNDATLIDAQGGTILPGIIDAHVHGTAAANKRRLFLDAGVTSVCDLGARRDSIARFDVRETPNGPAARGFRAGPIITAPDGLPGWPISYPVATPEEGRAAVIDLHERGVDMIKIYLDSGWWGLGTYPMLDQAQVNAIVEEAHARGLVVRAHIKTPDTLALAVTGGVDVIEHVPVPNITLADYGMIIQSDDPVATATELIASRLAIIDSLLAQAADQGIIMVPTLARTKLELEEIAIMPDFLRELVMEVLIARVNHFQAAGGVVALGSDYALGVGLDPGMPLETLDYLSQAGLTPLEILTASTRNAATACNQGDRLGTLEAGKLADVIVVRGDPSTDIQVLADVAWVISGGVIAVQP